MNRLACLVAIETSQNQQHRIFNRSRTQNMFFQIWLLCMQVNTFILTQDQDNKGKWCLTWDFTSVEEAVTILQSELLTSNSIQHLVLLMSRKLLMYLQNIITNLTSNQELVRGVIPLFKNPDGTVAKMCPVRSFENYINTLDTSINFLW